MTDYAFSPQPLPRPTAPSAAAAQPVFRPAGPIAPPAATSLSSKLESLTVEDIDEEAVVERGPVGVGTMSFVGTVGGPVPAQGRLSGGEMWGGGESETNLK